MQRTFIRAAAAALLCAGALAACGGGGGPAGVPPTTLTTPTPTATPTPTPTPTSNSGTATVTSAATAAPIPAAGGYTGTLNLPSSNAGGSVALALTTTTVAPSGLAPMAIVRRPSALPTGSSVLLYETIASPVTITFSATPEIDLTLPSQVSTSGVQFFIAAYDPAQGWQEPAAGPATVKGQSVTFASMPVPFTLQANVTYTLALYSAPVASSRPTPTPVSTATPTPAPGATPTPAPTPTPTPTPGASKISLSPSPLSVEVLKIGSFTASEAGYSGSFTAKLTSGTCEVWAPNGSYGSGGSAIAPDGIFDVGPSDSNPCSISVSDSNGNGATLDVSPTVATLGVSSSTLSLTGTGTANAQTFSTAGGLGPFTADSYDSSIISVSVDPIDQTTFHVTPLKAGQTTITVHDSTGQTTTVSVGVTTLSGVIQ